MRRTKIVCTIGPASESPDIIRRMIRSGMDVARFNFSHGNQDTHALWMRRVDDVAQSLSANVALMIDTKGPEIRLGKFQDGKATLKDGQAFRLTIREMVGNSEAAWVQYPLIMKDVSVGAEILLDDGNITLQAIEVTGEDIVCVVKSGGVISDSKKVNLPGAAVSLPAVSEKDMSDIQLGIRMGASFVAASFVRKAADILEVRRVIEDNNGDMHVIAKIENKEGVDNIDDILKVADGLMVARGDLGVEIPAEEVPILQKMMIEKCMRLGKPVITATQMLESMVSKPRPTRAEASDVANAIFDGTDAIMLSGETASGKYPVEAVSMMARIAERTEKALNYSEMLARRALTKGRTTTDAISHATCTVADELEAAAIITCTRSGQTTRAVARYRPEVPVIAAVTDTRVMRKLALCWGVTSVLSSPTEDTDKLFSGAVDASVRAGLVREGDVVIITAGVPVGIPGTTNMIKAHTIGKVVLKGKGISHNPVTAPVRVVRSLHDAVNFAPGEILVTVATHAGFVPVIEKSAGVIAEEGGLTSHAAMACLELNKAGLVGAGGATGILKTGMIITLDPVRGLVYLGSARV